MSWHITSFYQFYELSAEALLKTRHQLESAMQEEAMVGLIIVAPEGINGTVAGGPSAIDAFKLRLGELVPGEIRYKDSVAKAAPFRKISVIARTEIVSLKRPDVVPRESDNIYLSPSEWQAMLESDAPKVLIDTRNDYETKLGTFRGAVDPGMKAFSEWPDYVEALDVPAETPVMIFCTGGIRCEKAGLVMNAKGFQKVYQLRDGILGYLAEYPDSHFEGECFVFDERVAVDGHLQPSQKYGLCAGCGDPTQIKRVCSKCGGDFFTCATCDREYCSKRCMNSGVVSTSAMGK